jgi:hypothetical protein
MNSPNTTTQPLDRTNRADDTARNPNRDPNRDPNRIEPNHPDPNRADRLNDEQVSGAQYYDDQGQLASEAEAKRPDPVMIGGPHGLPALLKIPARVIGKAKAQHPGQPCHVTLELALPNGPQQITVAFGSNFDAQMFNDTVQYRAQQGVAVGQMERVHPEPQRVYVLVVDADMIDEVDSEYDKYNQARLAEQTYGSSAPTNAPANANITGIGPQGPGSGSTPVRVPGDVPNPNYRPTATTPEPGALTPEQKNWKEQQDLKKKQEEEANKAQNK